MKNKIAAFSALAVLLIGTAILHIAPTLAILAIATGDELTRALGLVVLLASLAGLVYLHYLNGSIRRFSAPQKNVAWDARHDEEMAKIKS